MDLPALNSLTPRQLEAVLHQGSPLMVLAGPGTGKTRTLTVRLGYSIRERQLPAEQFLAITFTNQAAEEMAGRIRQMAIMAPGSPGPRITTFHGFCFRLLKLIVPEAHTLLSESEAQHLLRETVREHRPDFPVPQMKELSRRISLAKGSLLSPEQRDRLPEWPLFPNWPDLYQAFQQRLREYHLWDFDELITRTVTLLETRPSLLETTRERFPFVLVDEFQDINAAQYRLFSLLALPGPEWMVIGDPNQAIYGFRGADAGFFKRLREDKETVKEIILEDTFRLNSTVLEASRQVLAPSPTAVPVPLTARKKGPDRLPVAALATAEEEARHLAGLIEMEMGGLTMLSAGSAGSSASRSFSDFAVLYRLHAQGERIGRVFQEKGIPYQRVRETHWADCPEVRRIFSGMKGLIPAGLSPPETLERVLIDPGPSEEPLDPPRRDVILLPESATIQKLRLAAATHRGDLESFLETLSLQTGLDTYRPDRETVKLLTLHAAKGLEFPVVIISGCEAGLIPLTLFKDTDPEEERRLFYVGCTRATEQLCFTWARERFLMGRELRSTLSPFVQDIAESLRSPVPLAGPKKTGSRRNRQMPLFK